MSSRVRAGFSLVLTTLILPAAVLGLGLWQQDRGPAHYEEVLAHRDQVVRVLGELQASGSDGSSGAPLTVRYDGGGMVYAGPAAMSAATAERDRLTAALRDRGLDVADSQANFVWLPVGEQTAGLAAALEARAVITRPFAGAGVRVTVGSPEEDDVFLAALDQVRADAGVR